MTSTVLLDRLTAEGTKIETSRRLVTRRLAGTSYGEEQTWLLTAVDHGSDIVTDEQRQSLLGTVRKVRSMGPGARPTYAPNPDLWEENYFRVEGAPLNPDMVNGFCYAVITADGTELYTIRYNDEDHLEDRHGRNWPYSILAGYKGGAWPHGRDSLTYTHLDDFAWVEVDPATAGAPAVTETETATDTAAETAPDAPPAGHIKADASEPHYGRARVEDNGFVRLDPVPADGETYLRWHESSDNLIVSLRSNGKWLLQGYFSKYSDNSLRYYAAGGATIPVDAHWALAALDAAPVPDDIDERKASLRRALAVEHERWDTLGTALTDLGDEKDWCGEYEDFATPLGLPARVRNRDWRVVGTASATFTVDSPSTYIDERIASSLDLGSIIISTMTITAEVTFDISVEDTSEDGARNYVDASEIRDWIENNAGASEVEIHSYNISSVNED